MKWPHFEAPLQLAAKIIGGGLSCRALHTSTNQVISSNSREPVSWLSACGISMLDRERSRQSVAEPRSMTLKYITRRYE